MEKVDLTAVLNALNTGAPPKSEFIALLVKHPASRKQILARPQLAYALASFAERQSGMSCENVTWRLSAYIDQERRQGSNLAPYSSLLQHLHVCAWCYDEYVTSADLIKDQQAGRLPNWFEPSQTPIVHPRIRPIVLPRKQIYSIITDWQPSNMVRTDPPRSERRSSQVTRGSIKPTSKRLVFADSVPEHEDLFAEITLIRPYNMEQDEWEILIKFDNLNAASQVEVVLQQGAELRRQRITRDGICHFIHLPASWFMLENAPDLLISVEALAP